MGEARRRGSFESRKQASIKSKKDLLIEKIGGRDERLLRVLRSGIEPFLSKLSKEEWRIRRDRIIQFLKKHPEVSPLEKAKSIRVREDEIGWYIFLCEQTLDDPLCLEISQAQRILPFFVAIGERWEHSANIKGLDRKIIETLTNYKSAPDGIIFEILVALSYAEKGWSVEFIQEKPPEKKPVMIVRKNGNNLYIECKRLDRRTEYSEKERNEFLRIWDAAIPVLIDKKQSVWLKTEFHTEVSTLPTDFLAQVLQKTLPIGGEEQKIHDNSDATIHARQIDLEAVNSHLDNFMVKEPSPMLSSLLGGDWAPDNSSVSVIHYGKSGQIVGCEAPILGSYIQKIAWACGITREFDSEISINKKARDITKLLSDAVNQIPPGEPAIIHIAAETHEGRDVELRRTEKVISKIKKFKTDKDVLSVRFHRFKSNSRTDKLYEFDETVEDFNRVNSSLLKDIPSQVVVPRYVEIVNGRHWEIYD